MKTHTDTDSIPQVKDALARRLLEDVDPFNCPHETLSHLIGHEIQEPAAVLFLAGIYLARARFEGGLRYHQGRPSQVPHAEALFDLQGFIAQFEALPGMAGTHGAAGMRASVRNIRLTLEASRLVPPQREAG
jgi:hypothetical protein